MAEARVKASDLAPGEMAVVDLAGTPVTVANAGGDFYAFDDLCTHRQCSLSQGEIQGMTVLCPCHGSKFNLATGNVIEGPATEALKTYNVQPEGDDLRVSN